VYFNLWLKPLTSYCWQFKGCQPHLVRAPCPIPDINSVNSASPCGCIRWKSGNLSVSCPAYSIYHQVLVLLCLLSVFLYSTADSHSSFYNGLTSPHSFVVSLGIMYLSKCYGPKSLGSFITHIVEMFSFSFYSWPFRLQVCSHKDDYFISFRSYFLRVHLWSKVGKSHIVLQF
jgi:hypothetical protein